MSEAPERIWINKTYGQHPEDWNFTDGQHLTKAQLRKKVEYVRADRIKELEAKLSEQEALLAKAVDVLGYYARNDDGGSIARTTLAELTGGQRDD